jgi:hypothetical protein
MRLVSNVWSEIGARYMFRDGLTVRTHRRDIKRLSAPSKHSLIASSIESITIFLGDMNTQEFSDVMMREGQNWNGTLEAYRDRGKRILDSILPRLENLNSITATTLRCPYRPYIEAEQNSCHAWEVMFVDKVSQIQTSPLFGKFIKY